MTTTKTAKAEKLEENKRCLKQLRKWLRPGDTVYTVLKHCSASGMSREIDLLIVRKNEVIRIGYYVARVTDRAIGNHGGVKIGGCGTDMGFALVYELSRTLFPKGFKVGRKGTHARNGDKTGFDTDGGYALNHSWL